MNSDPSDSNAKPQLAWTPSTEDSAIRVRIPVSVILEKRMISRSFWSVPSWYLHTVAVGQNLSVAQAASSSNGVAAGNTSKGDLFAWAGFDVTLYKDACERYWHALIGDGPLVYVICRDEVDEVDGDDGQTPSMQPISVTVDYDEASAAAETDVPVLSAPIPGELYKYMERFVLTHYKPEAFKKRKRRNWSDEGEARSAETRAPGQANSNREGQDRE